MYDNSKERLDSNQPNDDQMTAEYILNIMRRELEEELYSMKLEFKAKTNLLKEKQLELSEREKTKISNLDLFSPIHSKAYDTKELSISIDQIYKELEELNYQQEELAKRITGLANAEDLINKYQAKIREDIAKEKENSYKFSEKGFSILEAQEIERQRIARDLHDSTVQNLTSLVHKTELCIKLIDIDSIRAKLELNTMSNTIKTVINDMRGFIYNLKPMSLDDLGLTITVERFANKIMETNDIGVLVTSNEEPSDILPVIKLTIFRVIQEACNNVIKHARATLINISMDYSSNRIVAIIKDDGIGFTGCNQQEDTKASSFGISIMKERISLLNGTVEIQSEKEKGTIVTVIVPLNEYKEERNE